MSVGGLVRFSTEDVPARDRLPVWREVLGRVHLHLDVEALGEGPLRATVESQRWGQTSLYFSDTTPVRASRTSEFVQDGDGDFRLLYVEGAGYRYTANGVDEVVAGGSAALLFNGVVSSVTYLGPCRVSAVRVRRSDLAVTIRGMDDRPLRRVAPGASAFNLLTSYVSALREEGPPSDLILANRVATHLTDLVSIAVGATREAAESAQSGLRAARLRAIKEDVIAGLHRADMTVATIARRHGMSPRHVQRLFDAAGQTFTSFVLEQKVLRAYRMLSSPWLAHIPIGTIALDAGFADLSHFNHAFRRAYGMTPSDVRAMVLRE